MTLFSLSFAIQELLLFASAYLGLGLALQVFSCETSILTENKQVAVHLDLAVLVKGWLFTEPAVRVKRFTNVHF